MTPQVPRRTPAAPDLPRVLEPRSVERLSDGDQVGDGSFAALAPGARVVRGLRLAGPEFRGARMSQCEMRGVSLAGVQGAERLRGTAIPWVDVVENTGVWAAALGLRVVED